MTTAVENYKLDLSLTPDQKDEVERAAALTGKSINQWAVDHLLEAAHYDREHVMATRLDAVSFEMFSKALDNPLSEATCELLSKKSVWEQW